MTTQRRAHIERLTKRVRDGDYEVDRVAAADAMLRRCLWITAWDVTGPGSGQHHDVPRRVVVLPSAPPALALHAA